MEKQRWQKAQQLMLENALDIEGFAACLGKDSAQLIKMVGDVESACAGSKKISDGLARLMEQTFSKPLGWMDSGLAKSSQADISFDLFGQ